MTAEPSIGGRSPCNSAVSMAIDCPHLISTILTIRSGTHSSRGAQQQMPDVQATLQAHVQDTQTSTSCQSAETSDNNPSDKICKGEAESAEAAAHPSPSIPVTGAPMSVQHIFCVEALIAAGAGLTAQQHQRLQSCNSSYREQMPGEVCPAASERMSAHHES